MFLERFKEKTRKKHINSELKGREVSVPKLPLQRVGIIVNNDDKLAIDWNTELKKLFSNSDLIVDVVSFSTANKRKKDEVSAGFYASDVAWNGAIKNTELKTFINTEFNLLISYYTVNETLLKLLTASSKADFKVGILKEDQRINDLIINTELNAFDTFKVELIKYLKILKRS
ncbi:DUF6913 domain-containing protein [Bizionia paragorgiae]|uniref:DUF6913 domain-containing protein n=1 Tax=Bizionia paragorgiae TaxID=283786 RepID=UPI003A910782